MGRRLLDHVLMLLVVSLVAGLAVLGSNNEVFRGFFSWPAGATWSNMIASAEWVALIGILTWYFRDRVGRRLADYVHRHQTHHRERHQAEWLDAIRDHVSQELTSVRDEIRRLSGGANDDD